MDAERIVDGSEFLFVSRAALVDPLTGLPGPALLLDRIDVALARARRSVRRAAVFVLYDVCGIGSGDPPVRELAERLRASVRPDDTVARVSNRTFVVVCNEIELEREALQIAFRLLDLVGDSCRLGMALGRGCDSPRDVLAQAANRALSAFPKGRMRAVIDGKREWFSSAGSTTANRRCSRSAIGVTDRELELL